MEEPGFGLGRDDVGSVRILRRVWEDWKRRTMEAEKV